MTVSEQKSYQEAHPELQIAITIMKLGGLIVALMALGGILGNLLNISWLLSYGFSQEANMSIPTAIILLCLGLVTFLNPSVKEANHRLSAKQFFLLTFSGGILIYYFAVSLLQSDFDVISLMTGDYGVPIPFLGLIILFFCGVALTFLSSFRRYKVAVVYGAGVSTLLAIELAVFALTGYFFNIPTLYDFRLSVPSTIASLLLALSLLIGTIPYQGILQPLFSRERKVRVLGCSTLLLGIAILADGIMDIERLLQVFQRNNDFQGQPIAQVILGYEFGSLLLALLVVTLALQAIHFWEQSFLLVKKQFDALAREATVRRVVQIVHGSLELEEVFQKIVDEVGGLLKADRVYIARYNNSRNHLAPPTREFRSSDNIPTMIGADYRISPEDGWMVETMCESGKPLIFDLRTPSLHPETRDYFREIQLNTGIGCSIQHRDECLAILFIHQTQSARSWSEEEKALIQIAASQIALAIYQSQIYAELSASRIREEEVSLLSRMALSGADLEVIFKQAVILISKTLGAPYCKILQRLPGTESHMVFRAVAGWDENLVDQKFRPEDEPHGAYTLQIEAPVIVPDINNDSRISPSRLHLDHGIVSAISVIIYGETDLYGVLEADCDYRRDFSPEDVKFLQTVANVVGIVMERKHSEQASRESQKRFERVLQGSNEGFWDWDVLNNTVYCGERLYEMLGFNREETGELSYQTLVSLVAPADRERVEKTLTAVMREGDFIQEEFKLRHADGHYMDFFFRGKPEFNERGDLVRVAGMIADITQRKTFEQALAESNRDLEQFAAIASHDLQAPLRKMRIFSEQLLLDEKDNLKPGSWDLLKRLHRSVGTAQNLVSDLLALSKVSKSREPFTRVALFQVLDRVLFNLDERIQETRARIEVDGMATVIGDAGQLEQLLQNLLENGLKYQPKGQIPIIRVHSDCQDARYCKIIVEDNGIGFEAGQAERIFQPFERLHGKASPYEGSGVGLAICKRIVERHGGSIRADSEPGKGSRFIVRLPVNWNSNMQGSSAILTPLNLP